MKMEEITYHTTINTSIGMINSEAMIDDIVIGSISGCPHVGLVSLSVSPQYHRRGIGERLMKEYIFMVKSRTKCHKVVLTTDSTNIAAISLYKKLGFDIQKSCDVEDDCLGDTICTLHI